MQCLGLSPVKVKNFQVRKEDGLCCRNKVIQICVSVRHKPHATFQTAEEPINSPEKLKQTDEYQTLISSLQTKMGSSSSFEEKVSITSLLPQL
jgi:hypothetical protein